MSGAEAGEASGCGPRGIRRALLKPCLFTSQRALSTSERYLTLTPTIGGVDLDAVNYPALLSQADVCQLSKTDAEDQGMWLSKVPAAYTCEDLSLSSTCVEETRVAFIQDHWEVEAGRVLALTGQQVP